MRTRLVAAAFVASSMVLTSTAVDAAMTGNTIGPTADIGGRGAIANGTVLVGCTEGQLVQVMLTLTQGSVTGTGRRSARCIGEQQAITVTVPAQGGDFQSGNASACASADNKSGSVIVDTRTWCRSGGTTLT